LLVPYTPLGVLTPLGAIPARRSRDSLFQESIEEQSRAAGVAAIEVKGKFVEVGVHVGRGHRTLIDIEQPAFEQ